MILQVDAQALRMLKALGMRLRAERRRRGLTQSELAHAASVSRPTVIAAEAGRGVSSQSLAAMMSVLALDLAHPSAPGRPPLKDLMRAERERQSRRPVQLEPASPSIAPDEVEPHGKRITSSEVARTVEQQPHRRPLLKELMTAERLRRDHLDRKVRRERA
ncbi:MAG: helix-turn-helix domain-containing protein [Steroidobacteraceae bacterium]